MKLRFIPVLLMFLALTPLIVAAQTANPCTSGAEAELGKCVSQIYIWSLGVSGLLAVAVSVIGGYYVMTARGNGQQASKGKSMIYSSIAGLVLLMGAYLLLNTINSDLTNFSIPSFNTLKTPTETQSTPTP